MIDLTTITFLVALGFLGVFIWKFWEIRQWFIAIGLNHKEIFQISMFYLFNGFSFILEVLGFIVIGLYLVQVFTGFNPFSAGAYGRVYTVMVFLSMLNTLAILGEQIYIRAQLMLGGNKK